MGLGPPKCKFSHKEDFFSKETKGKKKRQGKEIKDEGGGEGNKGGPRVGDKGLPLDTGVRCDPKENGSL